MNFSRLQARYAIWEDSPVGRIAVKLLPLSLFSVVVIASVWSLEERIQQFTAIQDDQNTVILAQKKRIDVLEQRLNEVVATAQPSPSPLPSPAASPEAVPTP